jgi:urea transporter
MLITDERQVDNALWLVGIPTMQMQGVLTCWLFAVQGHHSDCVGC